MRKVGGRMWVSRMGCCWWTRRAPYLPPPLPATPRILIRDLSRNPCGLSPPLSHGILTKAPAGARKQHHRETQLGGLRCILQNLKLWVFLMKHVCWGGIRLLTVAANSGRKTSSRSWKQVEIPCGLLGGPDVCVWQHSGRRSLAISSKPFSNDKQQRQNWG